MGKTLNMDTFNEILFNALKDGVKKSELIEKEIEMAYGIEISKMEDLIHALNESRISLPANITKILKEVNNIDANLDDLAAKLNVLRKEEGEQNESN